MSHLSSTKLVASRVACVCAAAVVLWLVLGPLRADLRAQQLDLTGSWTGAFEDEFHWTISADSALHAECQGTLRIQLQQTDQLLAGELSQDQRCRLGGGEWFEDPNEGWLIAGGAVDGYDVTFSTIQDGGDIGLGTAFCRWRATFVLGMLRGRFDCRFSRQEGARAGGRFEITRQPGPKDTDRGMEATAPSRRP